MSPRKSANQFANDVITMTHDLRSPLAAIRGFTDVLMKRSDQITDTDRNEYLARIATNAEVLEGVIGKLRDQADEMIP